MFGFKKKKHEPWQTWEEYKSDAALIDEDTPPTVYRLNRMIALGFEIQQWHAQSCPDAIYLKHPNKKLLHRGFYLDGSGFVYENYSEPLSEDYVPVSDRVEKQLRFQPDMGREFEDFCRTIS